MLIYVEFIPYSFRMPSNSSKSHLELTVPHGSLTSVITTALLDDGKQLEVDGAVLESYCGVPQHEMVNDLISIKEKITLLENVDSESEDNQLQLNPT